jgi:hypothetical protein
MLKIIAGWGGKLLSYATIVNLIKAFLYSITIYFLSFFKFPKCKTTYGMTIKAIEKST